MAGRPSDGATPEGLNRRRDAETQRLRDLGTKRLRDVTKTNFRDGETY